MRQCKTLLRMDHIHGKCDQLLGSKSHSPTKCLFNGSLEELTEIQRVIFNLQEEIEQIRWDYETHFLKVNDEVSEINSVEICKLYRILLKRRLRRLVEKIFRKQRKLNLINEKLSSLKYSKKTKSLNSKVDEMQHDLNERLRDIKKLKYVYLKADSLNHMENQRKVVQLSNSESHLRHGEKSKRSTIDLKCAVRNLLINRSQKRRGSRRISMKETRDFKSRQDGNHDLHQIIENSAYNESVCNYFVLNQQNIDDTSNKYKQTKYLKDHNALKAKEMKESNNNHSQTEASVKVMHLETFYDTDLCASSLSDVSEESDGGISDSFVDETYYQDDTSEYTYEEFPETQAAYEPQSNYHNEYSQDCNLNAAPKKRPPSGARKAKSGSKRPGTGKPKSGSKRPGQSKPKSGSKRPGQSKPKSGSKRPGQSKPKSSGKDSGNSKPGGKGPTTGKEKSERKPAAAEKGKQESKSDAGQSKTTTKPNVKLTASNSTKPQGKVEETKNKSRKGDDKVSGKSDSKRQGFVKEISFNESLYLEKQHESLKKIDAIKNNMAIIKKDFESKAQNSQRIIQKLAMDIDEARSLLQQLALSNSVKNRMFGEEMQAIAASQKTHECYISGIRRECMEYKETADRDVSDLQAEILRQKGNIHAYIEQSQRESAHSSTLIENLKHEHFHNNDLISKLKVSVDEFRNAIGRLELHLASQNEKTKSVEVSMRDNPQKIQAIQMDIVTFRKELVQLARLLSRVEQTNLAWAFMASDNHGHC